MIFQLNRNMSSVNERENDDVDIADLADTDNECEQFLTNSLIPGVVGMQNIGNTCYMNAALQALSNTEAMTMFFTKCDALISHLNSNNNVHLSYFYMNLMKTIWNNRLTSVAPIEISESIRKVYSLFRGYQQHDAQEFLRCFMDRLHEELKEPFNSDIFLFRNGLMPENADEETLSNATLSEAEFETCDSGVSERSSLSEEIVYEQADADSSNDNKTHPFRKLKNHQFYTTLKKTPKSRSIISDLFDGKLLSTVQCLTCLLESSSEETFQDLSLPIPSREQLSVLHSSSLLGNSLSAFDYQLFDYNGWINWAIDLIRNWFYGPSISLYDCLSGFFSADELKGDNMYSCDFCKLLRNGVKFSKLIELPEILCIHLKRIRHDLNSSTKISNFVSFPITNLDLKQYLKNCSSTTNTTYDLYSVICHRGSANAGHYICYSYNFRRKEWFEFDDDNVRKVCTETVRNSEAYILFYRKTKNVQKEQIAKHISNSSNYYVSKQWLLKLKYVSEPGPINNYDFMCIHNKVDPERQHIFHEITVRVDAQLWFNLISTYSGGPTCTHFDDVCSACKGQSDEEGNSLDNYCVQSACNEPSLSTETHENSTIAEDNNKFSETVEQMSSSETKEQPLHNDCACSNGFVPIVTSKNDYSIVNSEISKKTVLNELVNV